MLALDYQQHIIF